MLRIALDYRVVIFPASFPCMEETKEGRKEGAHFVTAWNTIIVISHETKRDSSSHFSSCSCVFNFRSMRGVDWKNGCGFMGVRLVLFGFLASSVRSCEPKIALLFCERILLWRPSSACCRPQGCDDDFYCSTMTLLTWAQLDYLLGKKCCTWLLVVVNIPMEFIF